MQSPLRHRSRGCLVRPQVRLPQIVGTLRECRLQQPQSLLEVAGHALDKRILHALRISARQQMRGVAACPSRVSVIRTDPAPERREGVASLVDSPWEL